MNINIVDNNNTMHHGIECAMSEPNLNINKLMYSLQETHINKSSNYHVNQCTLSAPMVDDSVVLGHEKTPMALLNELAKFNKIQAHYTLLDENGPAHRKTFFVKVSIGDEEYTGSDMSIKKAQHSAAAAALKGTRLPHPQSRVCWSELYSQSTQRSILKNAKANKSVRNVQSRNSSSSLTPTVELNTLAVKRGETPIYTPVPYRFNQSASFAASSTAHSGLANQVLAAAGFKFTTRATSECHLLPVYQQQQGASVSSSQMYAVRLQVGSREFYAEGLSRQVARHNAASKALRIIKTLPSLTCNAAAAEEEKEHLAVESPANTQTDIEVERSPPQEDAMQKSEISRIYEVAMRHGWPVEFVVLRESGPAHHKCFTLECRVGQWSTCGQGQSKRLAKRQAASFMCSLLHQELPADDYCSAENAQIGTNGRGGASRAATKNPLSRKKKKVMMKTQKADVTYGQAVNPISRLIQIQQGRGQPEPVYHLQAERGCSKSKEFEVHCLVKSLEEEQFSSIGLGPNKKFAKRSAAEAMLQILGYRKVEKTPRKPLLKSTPASTLPLTPSSPPCSTPPCSTPSEQLSPSINNKKFASSELKGVTFNLSRGIYFPPDPSSHLVASTKTQLPPSPPPPSNVFIAPIPILKSPSSVSGPNNGAGCGAGGLGTLTVCKLLPVIAAELLSEDGHGRSLTAEALGRKILAGQAFTQNPPESAGASLEIPVLALSPDDAANCLRRKNNKSRFRTQQISQLCELLGLGSQYVDIPKQQDQGRAEYLSVLNVQCFPSPIIVNGRGSSVEEAHECAAAAALLQLADLHRISATSSYSTGY